MSGTIISTRLNHAVGYTLASDNPLTITSTGGILAASGGYGLSLGGSGIVWSVEQEGTVSAAGAIGVTLAAGSVTNTAGALIEGASYGIVLAGAGAVVNAGTISGGRDAVSFAAGAVAQVVVDPGAVFNGTVQAGAVGSSLTFAAGAAQGTFSGLGAHYAGFSSYYVASGGNWLVNGSNTLTANPSFVNAGVITVNSDIQLLGGTMLNGGTISGYGAAGQPKDPFDVTNASVTNEKGGLISGPDAVRLHNGATVVNAGTLTGSSNGVYIPSSGTVTNLAGGYISGTYGGISDKYNTTLQNSSYAALVNYGSIVANYTLGHTFYGVDAAGKVMLVNHAGGVIAGNGGGVAVRRSTGYPDGATMINHGLAIGAGLGIYVDGGTLSNAAGGTITGGTSGLGALIHSGVISNAAGGIIEGAATGVTGYGLIINAGTISGGPSGYALKLSGGTSRLVIDSGATFIGTVEGGGTFSSTIELPGQIGTVAGFGSSFVGFGFIALDAGSKWMIEGSAAGFGGETITGLAAGDTVELTGTVESVAAFAGYTLALSGGTTLTLPGMTGVNVTNDGHNTFVTACFASGTEITTARGQVAVETLLVGERVLTATGRLAVVRWIGHRRTDLRRHPSPHDVMPVRVRAGAFADKLPERDLVLSPDHAVLVDGQLVPIRHLVNNVSIVQETRDSVTYWHVELDRHDAILAEGMACESYLDTGNRHAFEGGAALDLHPDFGRGRALAIWQAAGCAPILTDTADPALRALHLRFLARAARETRLPDARRSA